MVKRMFSTLSDKELVALALAFGINHEAAVVSPHHQAKIDGVTPRVIRARITRAINKLSTPDAKEALKHLASVKLSDLYAVEPGQRA